MYCIYEWVVDRVSILSIILSLILVVNKISTHRSITVPQMYWYQFPWKLFLLFKTFLHMEYWHLCVYREMYQFVAPFNSMFKIGKVIKMFVAESCTQTWIYLQYCIPNFANQKRETHLGSGKRKWEWC